MNTLKNAVSKAVVAAAFATGAASASAELITDWDFVVTGEWLTDQTVFKVGAPGPLVPPEDLVGQGVTVTTPQLLAWGAEFDGDGNPLGDGPVDSGNRFTSRSALEIAPEGVGGSTLTGAVMTNGATVDTVLVSHFNNTISGQFDSLESAVFLTTLSLTSTAPVGLDGIPVGPESLNVPITFIETFNQEPCGFGSDSICDDIFVFEPQSLTFQFHIGDFTYTTQIGAPGLGLLSDATCAVAGVDAGCLGLTTPEGQVSSVQFNFSITGAPKTVPAPATLGLLGLGLLGFAARKRAKAA